MPHYLCKLKPPRTTFISDMTSDEARLMRAHREYWTPRVETGVVIAMGPVADPGGGYGVAIIEAASDAALESMQEADPAIAAGVGFAYENRRMLGIAVRPSQPLAPVTSVSP
ncbi:MAG TPA: YciI family protein [Roseiarcus sp.]|nr:YciI family protein [Roseiarcus sp.]